MPKFEPLLQLLLFFFFFFIFIFIFIFCFLESVVSVSLKGSMDNPFIAASAYRRCMNSLLRSVLFSYGIFAEADEGCVEEPYQIIELSPSSSSSSSSASRSWFLSKSTFDMVSHLSSTIPHYVFPFNLLLLHRFFFKHEIASRLMAQQLSSTQVSSFRTLSHFGMILIILILWSSFLLHLFCIVAIFLPEFL